MNKKNRALVEITLIYLIIGFSGWLGYYFFDESEPIYRFIYADLNMTVVAFVFSLIKRNSSVYDAFWSVIPFFFIVQWFHYFGGF